MNENSKSSLTNDIKINIDNITERKTFKKPKGWGHWNNFVKSDEYAKLIPGKVEITEEELAKHNKPGDMWIGLLHEKRICVFDVTFFADYHPGGYDIIKGVAGRDATEDFRLAHPYVNANMIARFQKGYLVRSEFKSPNSLSPGMTVFPPVRKQAKKPRWDWINNGNGDIVTLTFSLHKALPQKLNCISVVCPPQGNFKLRIFFDVEYYYFEIKFFEYLSPILESLESDNLGKSISIKLKNPQCRSTSTLGGIVEDSLISLIDAVNKDELLPCTVTMTKDLNHNCREISIRWPHWARVGIPLGHHVVVQTTVNGDIVQRPYTPICDLDSLDSNRRSHEMEAGKEFTLMIKRYSDGQLSSYIHSLVENESITVSLPMGSFKTLSLLSVELGIDKSLSSSAVRSIICLAAGSGITPMMRLIVACLFVKNVSCHLVFFNRTKSDLIYFNEFQALAKRFVNSFCVSHILSEPDSQWTGLSGRISESLCRQIIVGDITDQYYMICGSLGFNKCAIETLTSLRVELSHIFEFKG